MKRLFPVLCLLWSLIAAKSFAGSATWNLNPTNTDWNTAANWTPATVPNGASDVATFDVSNTTSLTCKKSVTVDSIVVNPGASSFTISWGDPSDLSFETILTVSGAGITNNSGITQNFYVRSLNSGEALVNSVSFSNSATVTGPVEFTTEGGYENSDLGGQVHFDDTSSAGSGTYINDSGSISGTPGSTGFSGSSTAGNGTFVNMGSINTQVGAGSTVFADTSNAGTGTFTNNAALVNGAPGIASTLFFNSSSASNATLIMNGSAVQGAKWGATVFWDTTTAANATLICNGGTDGGYGGVIQFTSDSSGGAARVELFGNGNIDISTHNAPGVAIGSVEGDGLVYLGARTLSIGSNNLSTTFSGRIHEGGGVTKIGSGTLTLIGGNTYTGATTISVGIIRATNKTGSATGTGPVNVTTGTLGGKGIVAGPTTIGTGAGIGAFLAPSVGSNKPATLTIESSLTFKRDGIYVYIVNTKRNTGDQVVTNGVTIESGAQFNFSAIGNKKLQRGEVFTAISNTSSNPISGTFANLPDGSIFTAGRNSFQASYEGGDGNDLTLTVVQ